MDIFLAILIGGLAAAYVIRTTYRQIKYGEGCSGDCGQCGVSIDGQTCDTSRQHCIEFGLKSSK